VALIKTGEQIDLGLAAELTGIDLPTLRRLNPGHKRWATDPDGPHHLLVPADRAESFLEKLVALPTEKRIHLVRHRVAPGEGLPAIARAHGTDAATLRRINRLGASGIVPGQSLLVPRPYAKAHRARIDAALVRETATAGGAKKRRMPPPTAESPPQSGVWDHLAERFRRFMRREL